MLVNMKERGHKEEEMIKILREEITDGEVAARRSPHIQSSYTCCHPVGGVVCTHVYKQFSKSRYKRIEPRQENLEAQKTRHL